MASFIILVFGALLFTVSIISFLKGPSDEESKQVVRDHPIIAAEFQLTSSAGHISKDNWCLVALFDDQLEIYPSNKKIAEAKLRYSQITDVYYGSETEIVNKQKGGIITRAAIGGLLFPGGAQVGAISGLQQKQEKKITWIFVISYRSHDEQDRFITFEDRTFLKGQKLASKLEELADTNVPKSEFL